MPEMIPVQSSNVKAIGYEPDEWSTFLTEEFMGTLTVEFVSGRTYEYKSVPESVFEGLRDAPSVGTYFRVHVLHGGYETKRVS